MKNLNFPLELNFKVIALANKIRVIDSSQQLVAFVHQKLFKLKEAISIYRDEAKTELLYTISADRVIDFSAVYSFYDANHKLLGKVRRKGMVSLWKAHYEVVDSNDVLLFTIRETNPWSKFFDSLFGVLSLWFFHPRYAFIDNNQVEVAEIIKRPSLFEAKFKFGKITEISPENQEKIVLAGLMMVLLERIRG